MLHRVDNFEINKLEVNEKLKVSPEFLENFILNALRNGYEFISLNELYELVKEGSSFQKKLVITLDDGYLDNYEKAYPIFKKYSVPFTIYITTSFPDKTAVLWWYVLEDYILNNDIISLSDGSNFICETTIQKNSSFLKIRDKILNLDQENILDELNKLFFNKNINWMAKNEEIVMSWSNIKELSRDPLATIGCHTVNHYSFNKLNSQQILREVNEAIIKISKNIHKDIEHFAFPFGSINEVNASAIEVVKSLNFKTCVTTRKGNIYSQHSKFMHALPRVMFTENYTLGGIPLVKRKRIVTI